MEIVHRDIMLIFKIDKASILGEFLIKLSHDRPGMLAAISNVFADHGINILNITLNTRQLLMHFMVDLTKSDVSLNDLADELKRFSFVEWVRYRVIEGKKFAIPSFVLPTFGNKRILVLDTDKVWRSHELFNGLKEVFRELGREDASFLNGVDVSELVKAAQLRGFGKVELLNIDYDRISVALCDEEAEHVRDLFLEYLMGLVETSFKCKAELQGVEKAYGCTVFNLRLFK